MDDLTKDEKKRCYIQKRLISDTREEPDTGESSQQQLKAAEGEAVNHTGGKQKQETLKQN